MAKLIREDNTSNDIDFSLAITPKEQKRLIFAALDSSRHINIDRFSLWPLPDHSMAHKDGYAIVAAALSRGLVISKRAQLYSGKLRVQITTGSILIGPLLFLKQSELHADIIKEFKAAAWAEKVKEKYA